MNPKNDQQNAPVGMPRTDQPASYHVVAPPRQQVSSQHAAADLIRGQLDNIYSGNSGENTPHTTPVVASAPAMNGAVAKQAEPTPVEPERPQISHGFNTAPPKNLVDKPPVQPTPKENEQALSAYERTMSTSIATRQPSKEDWQQYHSAWQKYYQMYYERTYLAKSQAAQSEASPVSAGSNSPSDDQGQSVSQKEAMQELRNSIRQKVVESADKARKSRHFMPVIAGLAVLLLFVAVQYNRPIVGAIVAYASPGSIDPQHIITDPTGDIEVGPEPQMIIPKINVDAPVVYGVGPDHNSQMAAMEKGIAHFSIPGANAVPGQVGNAVFAAHSSNDAFASGDYKFVFAHNERLVKGDVIYMNYEGKRYTYSVTTTEVVMPTEVSKIQIDTDKPMLTLISCVPLGTAEKRLLIFAEQISPDVSQAERADQDDISAPEASSIPGQPAPTLLERLFGAGR